MTTPSIDEQKARPFSERLIAALKPLMADPDKTAAHIHEVAANMAIDCIGELEAALSEKTAEIERLRKQLEWACNDLASITGQDEKWAKLVRIQARAEAAEARLSEVAEECARIADGYGCNYPAHKIAADIRARFTVAGLKP